LRKRIFFSASSQLSHFRHSILSHFRHSIRQAAAALSMAIRRDPSARP
jgi:hypothetical protein